MKKPYLSFYEKESNQLNENRKIHRKTDTESLEDTDYDSLIIVSGTMYIFTKEDTNPNNFIDMELAK
ncbi:hypothetical protein ACN2EP_06355 [Aliarcobacter butzleri]|uniref:hypothetical protein n=1 Tax=Aliarcobacter butzleri TaxID=28197 RepID=UPI003AFA386B